MKLIVQPDDGVASIVEAIDGARASIEIMIFRFSHKEIERALVGALRRGVAVHALIAFTNRGGDKMLRGLEMRLLEAGATVARTSDDLVRYHGKYLIVDGKSLYVLAFNFTKPDVERSRSFGLLTSDATIVEEAAKLFQSDCKRQPYEATCDSLLVSPLNARRCLAQFLKDAEKELRIFDLEVSDREMMSILKERAEAGVAVRIIGSMKNRYDSIEVRRSSPLRLHARAIVRDGDAVFLGSQSLRRLELDLRREVGIILTDSKISRQIAKVFDEDWESAKTEAAPAEKIAKKVAKAVAKSLPPVAAMLDEVAEKNGETIVADPEHLEQAVREAVKTAVRDAVHDVAASESPRR
jgi:phosphatidylserine/phosphatidylglycerophosphate/cardiolipin synthase-like enzyme